jgi:hypothetical protein
MCGFQDVVNLISGGSEVIVITQHWTRTGVIPISGRKRNRKLKSLCATVKKTILFVKQWTNKLGNLKEVEGMVGFNQHCENKITGIGDMTTWMGKA